MNQLLRYKNILLGALIIAVFSIIINNIYTHYSWELSKMEDKRKELEDGKLTIAQWEKLGKERKGLKSTFFSNDPGVFKQFVEEKARDTDVNISAIRIEPKDEDFFWTVTIGLDAICYYKNLTDFIKLLEDKKVKISSLALITNYRRSPSKNTSYDSRIKITASLEGIIIK